VRTIEATPEIAMAALQSIAQVSVPLPRTPIPGGHTMQQVPLFEPPPKRKRGRPRKIRPPKFDWTVWTNDEDGEPPAQSLQRAELSIEPPAAPVQAFVSQFVATGPRLRAGERWKRRIRVPGGGPLRPRGQ
jgi:hypothetical protein